MSCDECRELNTHTFRSQADLVHALQVAAFEMERGALEREQAIEHTSAEHEALRSALESNALPGIVQYRFRCTVCGERFHLFADPTEGTGEWTREGDRDSP